MQDVVTNNEQNAAPAADAPKSLDELIARTIPQQTPQNATEAVKQEAKPVVEASVPKEAPKQETKPVAEKKASVFDLVKQDTPKEEPKKIEAKPVEEVDKDPFEGVKENDWKAAKAAAAQRLAAVKAEQAKIAEKAAELEKELVKYRTTVPDVSEVERLRKEKEEVENRLKVIDYQSHPEFKRQYVIPKENIVNSLKTIMADSGITDEVDFVRLTEKPRLEFAKAVSEISEKLNSFDAPEFREQARKLYALRGEEQNALRNSSQNLALIAEQNKARQRVAFEQAVKEVGATSFIKEHPINKDDTPEMVQLKQKYNADLAQYRKEAEEIAFNVTDEKSAAAIGVEAANYRFFIRNVAPIMVSEHNRVVAERDQLRAEIDKLTAVKPVDGGDKGTSKASGPKTFDELIAQHVGR